MDNYYNETNQVEDEYDDLDDFIVDDDDGDGGNAVEDDYDDVDGGDDDKQDQEQPPEVEEEEEEEEEEEPPVGQQEILSLRERLKADLRRQYQSNVAGAGKDSSSPPVQAPVRIKFGNFFGPSRPSLAPRLIEAGCSSIMREAQDAPSRIGFAAPSVASKTQPNASAAHQLKPKIVSQELRKVDMLRQNRDYSDLFSDNANTTPAKEEPDIKPAMARKSDVQVRSPMQSAGMSKVPTNQPARTSRQHGSVQNRVQSKAGSLGKEPLPNGRKMIAAARNGSSSLPNIKKAPGLQPSANGQHLQSKRQQAVLPAGQMQQRPSQTQRPPQPSSQSQRLQKHGPPPSSQVSRMNSSSMQSQNSAQRGSVQSLDRSRLAQKQLGPSSKAKLLRKNAVYDDQANKKPLVKRKCSDGNKAILMIREMFNYNPEKFSGRDEDDRDMEADYRSIQMEERRSERLGRKEDEEQLRLIEEEERRQRAKKRKQ